MTAPGKLEKMLVLAFLSAEDAESGGPAQAAATYEALINPESYSQEYKIKVAEAQAPGTSGTQSKYECTQPEELTFDFLFDNTGLVDGKPKPAGVFDEVDEFRKVLTGFQGESHEPYHLKVVWGKLIFKGRAVEVAVTHKLFNPDGQPIRSVVKVKFRTSIEETKRAAQQNMQSPDMTHRRTVKPGDTLPLMCHRVYGDPRHYLFVAEANRLDDFRTLPPGLPITFPPLPDAVRGTR